MNNTIIVIGIVVLAVIGAAVYYFSRPKLPPPLTNPSARSPLAPPLLPPKAQPSGAPSPLSNLENQAINFGFDYLRNSLLD